MKQRALLWGCLFVVLAAALAVAMAWFQPRSEKAGSTDVAVAAPSHDVEAPPEPRRNPVFPSADDERIPFEDSPFAGADERSSYREFKVELPSGESQFLAATYLDEPDWVDDRHDDRVLITRLADLDAAFTESVSIDLPPTGKWSQVRLHVGDFAQDYCGDTAVVISFRSQRIFATTHVPASDVDLSASQCPLRLETYVADKARYGKQEEADDFSAFCAVRRACLKAHYEQAENRAALVPKWLQAVSEVGLH
ncbi:hypothetical protein [Niveibacterium sp.]|uniref:hypothetical protein n=1 Tax=Niveibacterium sp. TaxID=2017444 RepID=UPI0035AF17B2